MSPRPERRWALFPAGATADAVTLVSARGLRGFGDGFVSVLLPVYLTLLGLSAFQIGSVATATLLGSGALTVLIGLIAHRWWRRPMLGAAAVLMIATGIGFAFVHSYWPLLLVAFVGTLNPSSGDVSVFLPLEQTLIPQTVPAQGRTALYARYSLVGSLGAAFGALAAGLPALLAQGGAVDLEGALEGMFLLYAGLGLACLLLYRRLTPAVEVEISSTRPPLGPSRGLVYRMAALFSLDSFGGAFIYQPLLALWLYTRFDLSVAAAGTIFFTTGLLTAASQLAAAPLARRFGLINTMVFTHLPSNILLLVVPFMPSLPLAVALLFARSALSSMDVPARRSYVMAVVTPEERPAAAAVTSAPRSIATAASPLLSGYLLSLSAFGWPLAIAGTLKGAYDVALLLMLSRVKPPEEQATTRNEPTEARSAASSDQPLG
jgi:MFS family permease